MFPLGATTVTCTATDKAGNTGPRRSPSRSPRPGPKVLQPVNADGSSIFKLGSTVPVKFQLTGASAGITNLQARLYLQRLGSGTTGTSARGHLHLGRHHRQPVPLRRHQRPVHLQPRTRRR